MDTQAGAQSAATSHQTTIDLQAGIIASHHDEIGRANVKLTDQAAEIDRLKIVLADRQAKIAQLMGEVARAEMAADGDEITLLKRQIHNLKRHIEDYCPAAPAAPSEQAEPVGNLTITGTGLYLMTRTYTPTDRGLKEGSHDLFLRAAAAPAAPLPVQPEALATITLGGIEGDELGNIDIEIIDMKRLEALQYQMVRTEDPIYLHLYAHAVAAPLPELTGPSARTDISKRLRTVASVMTANEPHGIHLRASNHTLLTQAADEIERLQTAKSHLILQAQIWHCEAKAQRATVIGILARLGLPENDWEAKRLIVAHIAKLTGAPVPRLAASPSPTQPNAAATLYAIAHTLDDHELRSAAKEAYERLGAPPPSPAPAPTEPQELTLKDLAAQFCDAAESGVGLTISADSAALLFAAMTTPPDDFVPPLVAAPVSQQEDPRDLEIWRLKNALIYVAFGLHSMPQYQLCKGIALIDGNAVEVEMEGYKVVVDDRGFHPEAITEISAPASRMGGITSKESAETAKPQEPYTIRVMNALRALHIGDSSFEDWYSDYYGENGEGGQRDKQRCRDAYAAGMEDPAIASVIVWGAMATEGESAETAAPGASIGDDPEFDKLAEAWGDLIIKASSPTSFDMYDKKLAEARAALVAFLDRRAGAGTGDRQ